MLFYLKQILQKSILLKASCFIVFVLPYPTLAIQPMSESDLEIVSATTGSNILNIFGASQAGLKLDDSMSENTNVSSVSLNTENFNEGEATKPAALYKLRTIEEDNLQIPNNNTERVLSNEEQHIVLKLNEQTTNSSSVFLTSSEINYKTSNVHHQMRNIDNGGVAVARDLQIDLLKLENLRGDTMDDSRSAGSIYISDWHSQGDTRIITSQ